MILVGTGSKYETKDIMGISHFLEHMFFKGTKKRPTPIKVTEVIDRVGGICNAFTSQDYTGYWAKVDASHFDLALDWVSDIFLNSLLSPKEIEKEKGVVIEEINMYRDTPMRHIEEMWPALLYGDQPAGWDIAGTKESVHSLTRADFLGYMQRQYVVSNTIVCVAGNIDGDKVARKVEQSFRGISDSPFQKRSKVVEHQTAPAVALEFRKTDQTHIAIGSRAWNLFHPQRFTQEVLANILGGMMSSRLFVEVREKLGLAYRISTQSETNPDTGWVVTIAGLKNEFVEKAIKVILKEYKRIAEVKVGPRELNKAKDHLIGEMTLRLESSDEKASFYGFQEILEKRILTPEKVYAKIKEVTAEDVSLLAKEIFRPERLNLAVLGPFQEKTRFEQLLSL